MNPIKPNVYLILLSLFAGLTGCDIKKSNAKPDSVFTNIYNNTDLNASFYPLDIRQKANGNFVILAGTTNDTSQYPLAGTYIMETDSKGKFLWDNNITSGFVNPVPGFLDGNDEVYFIAMDGTTLQAQLMRVDDSEKAASVIKSYSGIEYPLYVHQNSDGSVLIVSYDRTSRTTRVTKTDASFNELWHNNYNVMEDDEQKVLYHVTKLGQQFPFFTGEVKNGSTTTHYFVNSFFNYSFSLLFINAGNGQLTGVVNGDHYDGSVSSTMHLSDTKFALSRYSFGDNYILPQVDLDIETISHSNNLVGTKFPDLNSDAKVVIREKGEGSNRRIVYITTTKVGQLVIHQFNYDTGELLKSKYFGHSNPVEVASAIDTNDGGMILLCRMIVAGRFPRIAEFKVSPDEFK